MMKTRLLTALALLILRTSANAMAIDPQCKKMRDPLGCTCALQNGGGINVKGNWYSKRGSSNAQTNEAFVKCQQKQGR
jgi:hypothetical protein